mmetsp:Transcript_11762/g.29771  ORF Transcript_11762/g.29771 Transcript_11762/m.29771 type:complete len:408 (-) Transcript_11762:365-1588(-)
MLPCTSGSPKRVCRWCRPATMSYAITKRARHGSTRKQRGSGESLSGKGSAAARASSREHSLAAGSTMASRSGARHSAMGVRTFGWGWSRRSVDTRRICLLTDDFSSCTATLCPHRSPCRMVPVSVPVCSIQGAVIPHGCNSDSNAFASGLPATACSGRSSRHASARAFPRRPFASDFFSDCVTSFSDGRLLAGPASFSRWLPSGATASSSSSSSCSAAPGPWSSLSSSLSDSAVISDVPTSHDSRRAATAACGTASSSGCAGAAGSGTSVRLLLRVLALAISCENSSVQGAGVAPRAGLVPTSASAAIRRAQTAAAVICWRVAYCAVLCSSRPSISSAVSCRKGASPNSTAEMGCRSTEASASSPPARSSSLRRWASRQAKPGVQAEPRSRCAGWPPAGAAGPLPSL